VSEKKGISGNIVGEENPMGISRSIGLAARLFCTGAAVWCVILSVTAFEYEERWVYQLSRWALCGIAAGCAWHVYKSQKQAWAIVFVSIAVIYNPIQPIAFGRLWNRVDMIAALGFVAFASCVPSVGRRIATGWNSLSGAGRFLLALAALGGIIVGFKAWEKTRTNMDYYLRDVDVRGN
jgi:hypothetical protein